MTAQAPSHLRRWLTLLLAGLLALGPFLHSHVGASHDTGFHLDGVHAVHATHATTLQAFQAPDEESPALGVGTSLPHSEDEHLSGLVPALLLAVVPLLLHTQPLPRPVAVRAVALSRYRDGLPPPGLAPPSPSA
ncbi:MAG: hypothetical protein ACKOWC_12660 [Limnohabitans sp.]